MQRPTPAPRPRLVVALAGLLVASLLLGACGGGSDDEGSTSSDGGKKTTTTTKPKDDKGDKGDAPESDFIAQLTSSLDKAGFDTKKKACVVKVAKKALTSNMDAATLDSTYSDECGVTSAEVAAAAYYAAMLDRGVEEKAAGCARDVIASLPADQIAAFSKDTTKQQSIATGCKIDPKVFEQN